MNRKVIVILIFLICFASNGFASLYFGFLVSKRAMTEAFKTRVEQSIILVRKPLQEGNYRSYVYSAKKFFSSVGEDVKIWLYSDVDDSILFSVDQSKFTKCQSSSFDKVIVYNDSYQYCQIVNGVVVQVNKAVKPVPFLQINRLHLTISVLTALSCSLLLIFLMRLYFSHLLIKVNSFLTSPRRKKVDEDISWLERPILSLYGTIDTLKEKLSEKEKTEILAKSIRQIVHDLGSPLSALNALSTKLSEEGSDLSSLAGSVKRRLGSIVEELQSKSTIKTDSLESFYINEALIENLLDLKEQFVDVSLKFSISHDDDCLVFGNRKIFGRIVSCLVQNSTEAAEPGRPLNIQVDVIDKDLYRQLIVTDNGKGIERENLDHVICLGVSIGKENLGSSGSGLGLSFAFDKVEEWGGRATIRSQIGVGTDVELTFLKVLD